MDKNTLKADKREARGRKVKALRRDGLVPANIFGKDVDSFAIQIQESEFLTVFEKIGETSLLEIQINGDKRQVLVSNVQIHPVTGNTLHVDFHQVNLKEKVTAEVPVEIVGESPAEKQGLGTVVVLLDSIEVEALPAELPEKFEVDVTSLTEADQAIYIKDLKFDKSKVEIQSDLEEIVVKVEPPQEEEVVETPTEEVAEGEAPAPEEVPAAEAETQESSE